MDIMEYKTPQAKVVEVNVQSVLCGSTYDGSFTTGGYTEESLDW